MHKIKYIPPDKNNERRNIAVTGVTTVEQAKEIILLTEGKPEHNVISQKHIDSYIRDGDNIMYDEDENEFMWFWNGFPPSYFTTYTYDEFIKACTKPKLSFLNIEDIL